MLMRQRSGIAMKVLMLVDTLRTGGKERQLVHLLRILRPDPSIEIHLALMDEEIHFDGVSELVSSIHYVVRTAKFDVTVIARLAAVVRDVRPDIVHTWDPLTTALGAGIAQWYGIPFVNGMIRNVPHLLHDPFWPFLAAWLTMPLSDIVVANTKAGLRTYHVPRRKGICVHNMYEAGGNTQRARSPDLARELGCPGRKFVGMVGTFSRFKDYRTFFAMAAIVARQMNDVTFLAVGDGPMLQDVKDSIPDGLRPRVAFLGRRADVDHIISGLHVGVLTSRREGMSNVLMEYMAWGLPIVTTAAGGTRELLPDEGYAHIVPYGDANAVAMAVLDVLNDPNGAREMGLRAQSHLRTEFSSEAFRRGFLDVYDAVLGRKGIM